MADLVPRPAVTRPAVTAIIVVRDGEPYLAEAIESVLSQTLDDWELLVVDDGSTDRTPDIVRSYAERTRSRIRLLAHPDGANLGIAASRNRGIASARGRYIAFLDADDVWLPEKLAEQVAILDSDPELGLVYGRTLIWWSWAGPEGREDFYYPLGVEPDRRHDPPVLFELLLRNEAQTPTTCNAMMRSDLFAALGGFEPRFRGMFEDVTFFGKALATTPAHVSDRTWAKYRQHSANCSAARFTAESYCSTRLPFLNWLSAHLIRTGVARTSPVWKAVQTHTWLCRHPRYFQLANQICFRKKQLAGLFARIRADRQTFALS